MSDTKRSEIISLSHLPTEGTEKYKNRDKSAKCNSKIQMSKNHRFSKWTKNTRYNLQRKNEKLSLQEELNFIQVIAE